MKSGSYWRAGRSENDVNLDEFMTCEDFCNSAKVQGGSIAATILHSDARPMIWWVSRAVTVQRRTSLENQPARQEAPVRMSDISAIGPTPGHPTHGPTHAKHAASL